jgi:hypothetical protein
MGQTIDDLDPMSDRRTPEGRQEALIDYVQAIASLGLIDIYHGFEALGDRDFKDAYYHLYIAGMAHASLYVMYGMVAQYERAVFGRAMDFTFHQFMQAKTGLLARGGFHVGKSVVRASLFTFKKISPHLIVGLISRELISQYHGWRGTSILPSFHVDLYQR